MIFYSNHAHPDRSLLRALIHYLLFIYTHIPFRNFDDLHRMVILVVQASVSMARSQDKKLVSDKGNQVCMPLS